MDRVRNEVCELGRELASRADLRVMRWFGHLERMDEYRMARSNYQFMTHQPNFSNISSQEFESLMADVRV